MVSRGFERIKQWLRDGNAPYPVHIFNVIGLLSFLMALLLIIFAGLDVYTLILFLFFGVGGFCIWMFDWHKRFIPKQ